MDKLNASILNPELFRIFAFWGSVLALKLVFMAPLTARYRFKKLIFANNEDTAHMKGAKVIYNDPDVERIRRAHLNDLENILIWYIVTFLWLTTEPSVWLASLLIRSFVIARIGHTLVYAIVPKQPHRAIAFFVGFGLTAYQAISTLLHYM
ncbi:Microsomal glutathione S-transferase 1 [Eufriesea mexicana]|uniref:microsomal glutathione S-transferase 1-like n=1 Tax=Eufriesea mexicana TaxID=516756 RepID=UPI00083BDD05|nr:PREDICTED: microsomal glutathione S-transferase 1-like [Eufriesea mexicana]OAD57597.1 Microsomal glutathione S-transferase 1 [Eufriesea mexicana]